MSGRRLGSPSCASHRGSAFDDKLAIPGKWRRVVPGSMLRDRARIWRRVGTPFVPTRNPLLGSPSCTRPTATAMPTASRRSQFCRLGKAQRAQQSMVCGWLMLGTLRFAQPTSFRVLLTRLTYIHVGNPLPTPAVINLLGVISRWHVGKGLSTYGFGGNMAPRVRYGLLTVPSSTTNQNNNP